MCIKLNQQLIATLLFVSLLLSLGMSFETEDNNHVVVLTNPSEEVDLKVHIADFTKLFFSQPYINNNSIVPLKNDTGGSRYSIQTIEKEQYTEELTKIESAAVNYEVTTYFLNIRTKANDKSNIIKVVKKGTMLQVIEITANGWLSLESGGFVNGKYTKIFSEKPKESSQVSTLSDTQTIVKNVVKPTTQSAINIDFGSKPLKPTSIVKSDSGLQEAQIEVIFKGTSLAGHGLENAILEIEEEYGINAYFTIAVMKLESANGESRISKNKNNLFGLNAIDGDEFNKALSFKTKGDSVRKFGQLISKNYVGEGYTTVEKISEKYCQANPKWSGLVKNIMKSDYRKL